MSEGVSEQRVEARRILGDVARQLDRKLSVEVRDIPGHERLQVTLSLGNKHHSVELKLEDILGTADDAVARHGLKLRLKRALDAMMFRKMPDHRLTVKATPPPVGFGRGKGSGPGGPGSGRKS